MPRNVSTPAQHPIAGLTAEAVYLRFRHGNRETDQAALLGYARPGDRRACRLLGWSRACYPVFSTHGRANLAKPLQAASF